MEITKYSWHRPDAGPTPSVLWVCETCGQAFWAHDIARRQLSCSSSGDPSCSPGKRTKIRRGTPEESAEAAKHIKVGELPRLK